MFLDTCDNSVCEKGLAYQCFVKYAFVATTVCFHPHRIEQKRARKGLAPLQTLAGDAGTSGRGLRACLRDTRATSQASCLILFCVVV